MAKKTAKKTDLNKVVEKYGPVMKKFGDEIGEVAKKGEEGVVKMSKLLKIQFDILGLALQKEKLYYEIGKDVAARLLKSDLEIPGLDKYKKQLTRMEAEGEKRKKTLSRVSRTRKAKKSGKKK
ncbi:MAG: hypothetical protein U9R44_00215 [Candidatus Omnitrophota bacterium]|nr:hypothetical protein [Candidatus Omnitrophota bacterium]